MATFSKDSFINYNGSERFYSCYECYVFVSVRSSYIYNWLPLHYYITTVQYFGASKMKKRKNSYFYTICFTVFLYQINAEMVRITDFFQKNYRLILPITTLTKMPLAKGFRFPAQCLDCVFHSGKKKQETGEKPFKNWMRIGKNGYCGWNNKRWIKMCGSSCQHPFSEKWRKSNSPLASS